MEKKEKENLLDEKLKLPETEKSRSGVDAGFWIALVAILISVATAFISLYEARLMKQQQLIMMEQKNASAWPYIEVAPLYFYDSDQDRVTIDISIINKGVGPAILGDVQYFLEGNEVESYTFVPKFIELHPEFDINFKNNEQIDYLVISANEKVDFLGFYIKGINKKGMDKKVSKLLNTLDAELKFCYCSIYKDCWKYDKDTQGEYDPCESEK